MAINRRNFMQQSAVWAAAFAAGTVPGAFRSALAARENELNILCWEGYNSAQVLDPFRSAQGRHRQGGVADQRPDDDQPAARRRDQHLGPDQRQQSLGPQGHVARGADQAARQGDLRALLRHRCCRRFKAPYKWAMSDDGERALGIRSASGPIRFVVNTDKISRATAEDVRAGSCSTTLANAGKYGILESDDWNVFNICIIAGFDPFKEHTTTRSRSSPRRRSASSRAPSWSATSPR
jgi:spermidine/putrescine transport system substrate-binding protein